MDTINKLLLSRREAAHTLSISLRSLEYLIARREIPTRRCGKRVLIPFSALERFARQDHPDALVPVSRPSDHLTIRGGQ